MINFVTVIRKEGLRVNDMYEAAAKDKKKKTQKKSSRTPEDSS